jgi:site-specific DNA-methyltransferase (adenine-specific)
LLQKLGFHILNDITWYKPNAAPNLACKTFAHSHETLLWAVKDKKAKHIFNYSIMKNLDNQGDCFKNVGKQMRTVWAINSAPKSEKTFGKHPTQKPLMLLTRIILASTNDGSVILDPFNGGGTTGLAANIIGKRQYIGIDIEEGFLDLTVNRIEQVQKQKRLIG